MRLDRFCAALAFTLILIDLPAASAQSSKKIRSASGRKIVRYARLFGGVVR